MTQTTAFIPLKDRPAPEHGDRIRVYRNLNRPSLFSIVALDGEFKGKVLGYAPIIGMTDVELKVSEKLRNTVLEKRVRNVHAHANGRFCGVAQRLEDVCETETAQVVTYQPYLCGHFFNRANPEVPVWRLAQAWSCGANLIVPNTN
jgi:hypothetical protein